MEKVYTHYQKGGVYILFGEVDVYSQDKDTGKWNKSVVYTDNKKLYIRNKDEFFRKFKEAK